MGRGRALRRAAALVKQATAQGGAQAPAHGAVPLFDVGTSGLGARCFVTALASRNPGALLARCGLSPAESQPVRT